MLPEMKYLATNYEPEVWWSDGDWEAKPEYFGSQDFLAWLYNESPTKETIVTNDRYFYLFSGDTFIQNSRTILNGLISSFPDGELAHN